MKSNTKKLVFVILLALVSVASSFAQSVSLYSNTGGGNWSNPDTWTKIAGGLQPEANNTRVPGDNAGNKVYITSGNTVVYTDNENVEIATLDVKGVLSITGNGSINVSSLTGTGEIRLSSFSKLKVSGSDLTTFSGTITLTDNVTIGTGSSFGKIVVNNGVATIDGILTANGVTVNNGASLVFKNQAGNVLNVEGDIKIDAGGVFTADGTNENIVNVKGNLTNNGGLGCEAPSGGESVVIPQMTEDIVWGGNKQLDWYPGLVISDVGDNINDGAYSLVVFYNEITARNFSVAIGGSEIFNEYKGDASSYVRVFLSSSNIENLKGGQSIQIKGADNACVTAVYITKDPDVVIANYTGGGSSSSSAQSAKLTFQFSGTSDAVYRNNGTASLYRIRGQKNQGSKITVTNRGTLDVFAETYNIKDYRNLPWSVSSGTLVLGEGVVIDSWGVPGTSGLTYNDKTAEYLNCTTNGYPLYVPEGATLQIAGAEIHVGKRADDNGKYGGVVISGNLVMSSGSLDLCDYSPGIIFNTGVSTPTLNVDGGVINTTVISAYDHKPASLAVNGGAINFKYSSKRNCAKLSLSRGGVFAMSDGELNFYEKGDDNNSYAQVNGIWLADATVENTFPSIDVNVTGGDINIIGAQGFEVFANGVTFHNLNVKKNGGAFSSVVLSNVSTNNTYWADNNFRINDLVIEDGCGFNASLIRLGISGNVQIGSGVSLVVPDGDYSQGGGQTEQDAHNLVFLGRKNTLYRSATNIQWKNVEFQKTSSSTLDMRNPLYVKGKVLAEYNGKVKGDIYLVGSEIQSIKASNASIFSGVNLFVKNAAGVVLASDIEMNSVKMSVANRFNLVNFNLKLHSYPTSDAAWGVANMFLTDNSAGAKGLTLPAKIGTFPIGNIANGIYRYSYVSTRYESSGNDDFITVTPVYGAHPMAKKGNSRNEKLFNFYWVIESSVQSVNNNAATYDCKVEDNDINNQINGKKAVAVIVDGAIDIDNTGSFIDCVLRCAKRTYGDFTVSGNWAGNGNQIKTFYSTGSGSWKDAIWTTDEASSVGTNASISTNDNVVIRNGHTVTCNNDNKPTVGQVTINEGGKFIIEGSIISSSTITKLKGDGTLQINYSTFKLDNTDCTEFYNNENAKLVFLLNSDANNWYNSYDYVPNLEILSENETNHSFEWILRNGVNTTVRGDLTIGKGVSFVAASNGTLVNYEVFGRLKVSEGAIVSIGHGGDSVTSYITKYAFRGDIDNNGTIQSSGANDVDIYGNIVNNNVINIYKNRVYVKGDKSTVISGTASYGQTNLGSKLILDKSTGTLGISAQIPVCNSSYVCPLFIESGIFSHQYNNRNGNMVTYKGDANFAIPYGSGFSVQNGNVCIYTPEANHVAMGGQLTINNSTILVGTKDSDTKYGSIQYINGSSLKSYGTTASNSKVYMSSLGGESGLELTSYMTEWYFKESGSMPINYGVFDIRDASSVVFDSSSKVIVESESNSSKPEIYYHPSTSDFSADILLTNEIDAQIDALSPLSNIIVDELVEAEIINSPLTVATLTIRPGATFNCNSIDLSLLGDLVIDDVSNFTAGNNTVYFIDGSKDQSISVVNGVKIIFNNLVSRSRNLSSSCNVIVNGDFTLDNGIYSATNTLDCLGAVNIKYGTTVAGNGGLHMVGTSVEQSLNCEGTIEYLEVKNSRGINANNPQGHPITIGKELMLTSGCLKIGGNILEIEAEADIVDNSGSNDFASFDASRMIMTNASYTDRGIRVHMKAGTPKTITLPLGEGTKYSPVTFTDITSTVDGYATVYGNNGAHFTISSIPEYKYYLQYYWAIQTSADFSVRSGSIQMRDDINDVFVDGDLTCADEVANYITAVLHRDKFSKAGGRVDKDVNNIILDFDFDSTNPNISGIYTAGRSNHLPDNVPTYISVASGQWDSAIWKLVGEDGTPTGEVLNAVKNGHGFYIGSGTTVILSPSDIRQRVYFLEVQEDAVVNFTTSHHNNMGTVTGTGKIVVETASALPGGNYEEFFSSTGGTIEYAGNEGYNIFVGIPHNNNVILSGSGVRSMPNSNDVVIFGNLSFGNGDGNSDDLTLEMFGKDIYIGGDLTFNADYNGNCSGEGTYIFNGTSAQRINSNKDIALQGLGIDNAAGLTVDQDLTVDKLILNRGIITLNNSGIDKTLTLGETSTITSTTGFASSFIDGKLSRYITNNVSTEFYVGDKSSAGVRNGTVSVEASGQSGYWTVRYVNDTYAATLDEIRGTDESKPIYNVESIGNEYWEVEGPSAAKAKVKLRWDSNSGGFIANKTKVISKDPTEWTVLSYRDASQNSLNGTLVTYPYITNVSGGPRVYAFATAETVGTYTWIGAFGSRWDIPANWDNQLVPGAQSSVTIPYVNTSSYSYPIIDENVRVAYAGALTIDGGELTLEGPGTTFTVNGDVKIQTSEGHVGALMLNYKYNSNPNFILNGEITEGDVTVSRTIRDGRVYYMGSATEYTRIQSPRAGDNCKYSNLYVKRYNHTDAVSEFTKSGVTTPSFVTYGENQLPESLCSVGLFTSSSMPLNLGDESTLWQFGKVSSAKEYEVGAFLGSNWYSNPYPFALNVNAISVTQGSTNPTLYSRICSGDVTGGRIDLSDESWQYQTFNINEGVGTFTALAPFQGFEMICDDSSSSFSNQATKIKIEPRPYIANAVMQKSAIIDSNKGKVLRLYVGNKDYFDQLVLLFNERGKYEIGDGDSFKKANPSPDYYSEISTDKGGSPLVISRFPEVEKMVADKSRLPINITKANKSAEVSVWIGNMFEFDFDGTIYLIDHLTEEYVRLSEIFEYICPDADNLYKGRFELTFVDDQEEDDITAIDESVSDSGLISVTSNIDGIARITIFGDVRSDAKVVLYDILGRVIREKSISNSTTDINVPKTGVFVVKVVNGNESRTSKIML